MIMKKNNKIGFVEAASIGIGGMVGGGIFAVLGLAVQLSEGGAPVAFLIAGIVALFTAYSYSKLSVTFPGKGGTVSFLDRAFGPGMFTGSMNILLWISYIIMLSLYAFAFGSYGAEFFPGSLHDLIKHLLISGIVVTITVLNIFSAKLIGKAEDFIVVIKLLILVFFCFIGLFGINSENLAISNWSPASNLIAGGFIIFLAYEGFELIANTSDDIRNPEKTLPRAYYASVIFVIILYIFVSAVTVGNLPIDKIVAAKDYALAMAAKPFLGQFGFVLISIAALLSTTSAINATLYGSARLSYVIAKDGELPEFLEDNIWNKPLGGLLITSLTTLLIANLFDLSSLSTMGSAGFLIIFTGINLANVKLSNQTKSKKVIPYFGAGLCVVALGSLIWQTVNSSPKNLLILISIILFSVGIEGAFRLFSKRKLKIN